MQLTGPKKLLSNCSRTRVCARGDAASSSTVPTSAIVTISLHPSTPVIYGVPNLHLSSIAVYPISQMSPQPQQQQPDTGPSHCSPHISPFFQPSKQTTKQSSNTGPSHLPSNSNPLHLSFHPSFSHSRQKSRNPSPRRVSLSSSSPSPWLESAMYRGFKPAITLSPWESA